MSCFVKQPWLDVSIGILGPGGLSGYPIGNNPNVGFRPSTQVHTPHYYKGFKPSLKLTASSPLKVGAPWKFGDSELGNHHFLGANC